MSEFRVFLDDIIELGFRYVPGDVLEDGRRFRKRNATLVIDMPEREPDEAVEISGQGQAYEICCIVEERKAPEEDGPGGFACIDRSCDVEFLSRLFCQYYKTDAAGQMRKRTKQRKRILQSLKVLNVLSRIFMFIVCAGILAGFLYADVFRLLLPEFMIATMAFALTVWFMDFRERKLFETGKSQQ